MARPSRNASPDAILSSARTFFATTKTSCTGEVSLLFWVLGEEKGNRG
jgi:hypothetical protein